MDIRLMRCALERYRSQFGDTEMTLNNWMIVLGFMEEIREEALNVQCLMDSRGPGKP